MSRLDGLIAEHCPDGVEFETIDSITQKIERIKWAQADDEYQYIDLTSVDRVTGRIIETSAIDASTAPSRAQQIVKEGDVLFGTTRPTLQRYSSIGEQYDGQIASTGYCVLRANQMRLAPRFLFHILGTSRFQGYVEANQAGASYPAISDSLVKAFPIPVPPLEVQREIVRILDTFTALEAELEAELEARRIQYEHYRNDFMVDDAWELRPLGDIASVMRGASPRPIRNFITDDIEGIPWIKIGDVPTGGKYVTQTAQRITLQGAAKSRRIFPGDFVLSNSMSFGRPYISKIEGCIHDGWLAISDFDETFQPDFLYHLLGSVPIQSEFTRRASSGTVKNLNADIVKSVLVPTPPIKDQNRIVDILDKFETLVNDLRIGLPAEIEARRKQYEYYRDKLLTFDEVKA